VNSKHRYSLKIAALVHPEDMISINFPHLFKQMTCPALFISSDVAKGAASGENDIAGIQEMLPRMRRVHVGDAGHNIRREHFAQYMDVVQNFLADLR
jgi:hypothetical protein